MVMETFVLPDDFLLGTATAGLQIEGGDWPNSWTEWAERGNTRDGSSPRNANDHWNRVEDDTRLLVELGVRTHRLSVEWARIEPDPGRFSDEAIDHYRAELLLLRRHRIEPLVTLHHFTNPLWVEHDGGWLNPETADRFNRYVAHVAKKLGDLVGGWVTINEPNVYLYQGYVTREGPPGVSSVRSFFRASRVMIRAHLRAYRTIKEICGADTRVGVAHHVRRFEPDGGLMSRLVCRVWDRVFHRRFIDPMSASSDFLGVNYYTRDLVRAAFRPGTLFGVQQQPPGETNDLGWEIYPSGLFTVVKQLHERHGLPVFITENGICDRDDVLRSRFIFEHLRVVRELRDHGVPVERYYHWTLIDNFEWNEGETAPFGLYHNNFETQVRTLRGSGRYYQSICATNTVEEP